MKAAKAEGTVNIKRKMKKRSAAVVITPKVTSLNINMWSGQHCADLFLCFILFYTVHRCMNRHDVLFMLLLKRILVVK